MSHSHFIKETLVLAITSRENGNHPFGALLVHNGSIILRSENTVVTSNDVTQHAELNLVREASIKFGKKLLKESSLYTSTEPCAMCAGAIYWAGIRKVIFGLTAQRLGELTTGSFIVESKTIFQHGTETVDIVGPIDIFEAEKVHYNFWAKERPCLRSF